MKLIVGLGNPGKEYERTRHNIGWRVVDELARTRGVNFEYKKKFDAEIAKDGDVILCKPQTFMNNSGQAVAAIVNYFSVTPKECIVVYDDKDIPFGTIRLRASGSSGGHNGVQSVIQHLGAVDFPRMRIGVANEQMEQQDTADFVLQRFSAEEEKKLTDLIQLASETVNSTIIKGFSAADHGDIHLP